MECNKDEALRAKQIAESKMASGDFAGALKFAMKAKNLFPNIENITQILMVCEVHCAAQKKLFGSDRDWYAILQTERLADEATIKKQYRKLALLLHPDKNKSAGAEAAFKLIGEANVVLSDKSKRSFYDIKCAASVKTSAPKPPSYHSNGSAFGTKQQGRVETFWTSCQHCKTGYQYYRTIENATLRCQHCSKSFKAHDLGKKGVPPGYTGTSFNFQKETPNPRPPKTASESDDGKPFARGHEDKFAQGGENNKDGYVAAEGAKADVGSSKPSVSKANKSQTSTKVGSKRAKHPAPDMREDCDVGNVNNVEGASVRENGVDSSGINEGVHPRRSSRKRQHVSYMETSQDADFESSPKKPRKNESFNATEVEKRKVSASSGLFNNNNPASSASSVGSQDREVRDKTSGPYEETASRNERKVEQSHLKREDASKSDLDDGNLKADNVSPLNRNAPPNPEIFVCPDPEFSDFEKNREENCFAVNQFWAIYDTTDSMPRFYALVKKVFSPFKLQITWLEPDPDAQVEIDWLDADLPIACGKFKLGSSQRTIDRAMFSHKMHCIKGSGKGSYLVYPKKGETWAIFRDWNIGWSSNPEKLLGYEFEYVEVLSDFDDDVGIEVAYLGKVKGFVSLFQHAKQNGISLFWIPSNELYRFSHQIPSCKMAGDESEGVPRGSFELDPAGLPLKLFEIGHFADVKMEDGMLNNGVSSGPSHESSGCKVEHVMSSGSIHKAKLHENKDAEKASSILKRSPRSNIKSLDNGRDKEIGHKDNGQPEGTTAACQANERDKTPKKHEKNNYGEGASKVRRSPRDLSKKYAQVDASECSSSKENNNHSNANKSVKGKSFFQSVGSVPTSLTKDCRVVGASSYDFKKEKSEERFHCGQIWAIYSDRDRMPQVYVQIKKIESTPNFRLHVSLLEPCTPLKALKRPVSCGTFKIKNANMQILSCSSFSHQLKVEPMANNKYEIYPRKGEIWALYKDQNSELTYPNQGSGECHIVEVLADSDKIIQAVLLTPLGNSQPFFKAPRIQRSKTGIIEILRSEVGRFSHRIPAFHHSGEDNVHLRGCWVLDPSSIPGFVVQLE